MAYRNKQIDGFVHEAVASLSPRQTPYVKLVVRQGEVKNGEPSYTYYTCFMPSHMFANLEAAQKCAARYAKGRHVLVSGRPRYDVSLQTGLKFPLTVNSLAELNEKCRVNCAIDVVGVPELLA